MIIKPDWTQPYLSYLLRETPSHGTKAEASCLAPHAKLDTVVRDELYKRGKSEIIEQFRCEVARSCTQYLLRRVCGHHMVLKMLVRKAF
jgi:hypothetical protein